MGYSRLYGCYIDAPQDSGVALGYPSTTPNVFTSNRSFDDSVVAGEYIQRSCGMPPQIPANRMTNSSAIVSWAPQSGLEVTTPTTSTTTTAVVTTSTRDLDALDEAARAAALASSEQIKEEEEKIAAATAAALVKGRDEAVAALTTTSTTAAPAASGNWILWVFLAILMIIAISLCAVAANSYMRGQKVKSRKRAMKLADTEYDKVMHLADAEYDSEYGHSQERSSLFSLPLSFLDSEVELPSMSHQPLFSQPQVQPVPQYNWMTPPTRPTDPVVDAAHRLFDAIDSNHDGVITREEFGLYRQPATAAHVLAPAHMGQHMQPTPWRGY